MYRRLVSMKYMFELKKYPDLFQKMITHDLFIINPNVDLIHIMRYVPNIKKEINIHPYISREELEEHNLYDPEIGSKYNKNTTQKNMQKDVNIYRSMPKSYLRTNFQFLPTTKYDEIPLAVFEDPDHLIYILEKYTQQIINDEREVVFEMLSENPAVTPDIVRKYPIKWDRYSLYLLNPLFTPEHYINNYDIDEDAGNILSFSPLITWEFINNHRNIEWNFDALVRVEMRTYHIEILKRYTEKISDCMLGMMLHPDGDYVNRVLKREFEEMAERLGIKTTQLPSVNVEPREPPAKRFRFN